MSILAAVATFIDDPGRGATARSMLQALPDWAPDGREVAEAKGAALGIGKLVVSARQGHGPQPLHDREAGLLLVADVRIDNRDELRARFALPPAATDAEIVLAGFRRHGAEVVRLLVGDFAFSVWDERSRTLFAARDAYGARPLVYRQLPDRLLVASDVEQILAVDPSARVIDDVSVVDWLLYRHSFDDRSYFEPIKQVPAGSELRARAGSVTIARWWAPVAPGPPIKDEREGLDEFRQVFARAVADRLVSDHPIVAHLSGGFDSSVIALVAGQVGAGVPLRAVGGVHPGLDCDEAPYMRATAARLPYPFEPWNANTPDLLDFEAPALAGPGLRVPRSDGSLGDLTIARREGARVILSGLGGDGLHPAWELVGDFLRRRQWRLVLRATLLAEGASWAFRRRLTRQALRLLVPRPWARRWRALKPRASAPSWLAPRFWPQTQGAPLEQEDHDLVVGRGGSARLHEWRRPLSLDLLRNEQRVASEARAECRCPFLDARVAALADRLPLSIWQPGRYGGRLHALAYDELLPGEVRSRRRKTVFGSAITNRLLMAQTRIEQLLAAPSPASRRYLQVEPAVLVREVFTASSATSSGNGSDATMGITPDKWQQAALVWKLAALEAWLRMV